MAPEPLYLVGVRKSCPRCGSQDVKYAYDNNNKPSQPRYKCMATREGCGGRFFTHGGKVRVMRRDLEGAVAADRRPDRSSSLARRPGSRSRAPKAEASQLQEIRATSSQTAGEARVPSGRCIPQSGQAESQDQGPTRVVGTSPAPVAGASHVVADVDRRTESTVNSTRIAIQHHGDVKLDLAKAITGIPPYGLGPPSSSRKRQRFMRIKCNGKESVLSYWVDDTRA